MDFELSDDQRLLRDTAANFAKKESPVARRRALSSDPMGYEPKLWRSMGELGLIGVMFPEEQGGFGGSFVEAMLILEQFGTTLVPEPYLPSIVAGSMIAGAGTKEQCEQFIVPLIVGESSLAVAYAEKNARYSLTHVETRAEKTSDGFVLAGEKTFVLNGHGADAWIVSARTAGAAGETSGLSLFVIPKNTPGVHVTSVQCMDGQRAAMLRFEQAKVPVGALLGELDQGHDLLELAVDTAAAAACAEGLGIMDAVLTMTVDYLKTREQFGVKIGTFQALQHTAVNMFTEKEVTRSQVLEAAIRLSDQQSSPEERRTAVSAAKVQLATGGRFVTEQGIQLHGGIAITEEHDMGLFFKRMHVLNSVFGDEAYHLKRFAHQPAFSSWQVGALAT